MNILKKTYFPDILILSVMLAGAAFIRFWAAPLSAGPDVAQYWAFARQFQEHGLDFYRYAEASGSFYPYEGWNFVYPPIWLLILRVALLAAPDSFASVAVISTDWRIAEKTPIILADLAIGLIIYRFIPGSRRKKTLFTALWLFNPAVWYQSAVFGQFDAIAAVFLLAAVIMLIKGKDLPAFILAGLAVMTKHHTLIAVAVMLAAWYPTVTRRRFLRGCGILAGVAFVISLPFLVTGNFGEYARMIMFGMSGPGYQEPLSYAFNGVAALLTYLHIEYGWALEGAFKGFIPVLAVSLAGSAYQGFRKRLSLPRAALIGFLLFLVFFYRINYQYLVIFIPLALYIAGTTGHRSERIYLVIMSLLPSVWMWLFHVGFWFETYLPLHPEAVAVLDKLALTRTGTPELWFVIFSGVLWVVFLAYIIVAFWRWRKPARSVATTDDGNCT